jgi:hypothetical protein
VLWLTYRMLCSWFARQLLMRSLLRSRQALLLMGIVRYNYALTLLTGCKKVISTS